MLCPFRGRARPVRWGLHTRFDGGASGALFCFPFEQRSWPTIPTSTGTNTASRRDEREQLNGHKGCVIWFTGLSACGKSTIANLVDHKLHSAGLHSFVLDGDNVRHGLNAGPGMLKERHGEEFAKRFGLGFSAQDREENIRRIGAVAKLFCRGGRRHADRLHQPLSPRSRRRAGHACKPATSSRSSSTPRSKSAKQRDPKGLYKKARAGELKGFTGIDDPYEAPDKPELVLDAGNEGRRDAGRRSDRVSEESRQNSLAHDAFFAGGRCVLARPRVKYARRVDTAIRPGLD